MTPLQQKALASVPLPETFVADIYDCAPKMTRDKAIEELQRLCVSHERLRAELLGAEALLTESGNPVCKCGKPSVFNGLTDKYLGVCDECKFHDQESSK